MFSYAFPPRTDGNEQEIYTLTFSNPYILKSYFLEILNISISELSQLKKLYDVRNDIMHRNGKNIKGVTVIDDEMDLDLCLNQVKSLVQEIINYRDTEVKTAPILYDIELDGF